MKVGGVATAITVAIGFGYWLACRVVPDKPSLVGIWVGTLAITFGISKAIERYRASRRPTRI